MSQNVQKVTLMADILYMDDLAITSNTMEKETENFQKWKEMVIVSEVNIVETKVIIKGHDAENAKTISAKNDADYVDKG